MVEQFIKWQEDFTLNVEEPSKNCYSVSLADAVGETIIKFPAEGCSKNLGKNLKYLNVATGWGASGNWTMNIEKLEDEETGGFNPNNREPVKVLDGIIARYGRFMNEAIPHKSGIIKSINKRLDSVSKRMKIRYAKLDSKCDFHQPNEIPDSERYEKWNKPSYL